MRMGHAGGHCAAGYDLTDAIAYSSAIDRPLLSVHLNFGGLRKLAWTARKLGLSIQLTMMGCVGTLPSQDCAPGLRAATGG